MTRPDFNADPEIQVLNELLWSPNEPAVTFVLDTLREDDFYNPLHGQVFTVIKDNHARGHGRDAVNVNTHLLNNHDELGIGNPQVVSHLLVNIAVLATPHHNLRDNAHAVLTDSYRRGFDAVADSLAFAAKEAPTEKLFDILVEHGKQQRTATERLDRFTANYNTAAQETTHHTALQREAPPETMTELDRIKKQQARPKDGHQHQHSTPIQHSVGQGVVHDLSV